MTTRSRKKTVKPAEAPSTDASPEEVLAPEAPADVVETPDETPAEAPVETPVETADEPVKETRAEPAGGGVTLVYRGNADVFSHGAFRIRPGQPVTVPSDVAEELLTFPRERFEKVESQE